MPRMNLPLFFVILLLVMLAPATPAYAYLDPGSGSYLIQVLLAMAVGGLAAVKMSWVQVKAYFYRIFGKTPVDDPSSEKADPKRDRDQL